MRLVVKAEGDHRAYTRKNPVTGETEFVEQRGSPAPEEPKKGRKKKTLAVEVGEHVTGTRWEKAQAQALTLSDLNLLSPEEQAKRVTKKLLLPTWDPNELLEAGCTPEAILLRSCLEKCIREKPENEGDLRRFYLEGLDFFAKSLDKCRTREDVMAFLEDWHHLMHGRRRLKTLSPDEVGEAYDHYAQSHGKEVRMPWAERKSRAEALKALREERFKHPRGSAGYSDAVAKEQQARADFDKDGGNEFRYMPLNQVLAEALATSAYGFEMAHGDDGTVTVFVSDPELPSKVSKDNKYARMAAAMSAGTHLLKAVGMPHPDYNGPKVLKEGIATVKTWKKEGLDADAKIAALMETLGAKRTTTKPREAPFKWERDVKGEVDRKGGQPVEDVTPQMLAEDFGFKNVQFGNWVTDSDANSHLKGAYGAFADLAEIFGVSPKQLSLNGRLAIGFGARGSGKFAAHYEPDKRIINITKIAGGGSLAHEWAHALDNLLTAAFDPTNTKASRMVSNGDSAGVPPRIKEAFDEAMGAIRWADPELGKRVEEVNTLTRRLYAERRRATPEENKLITQTQREARSNRPSDFMQDASTFSKGADSYWTRPHELFARAFEAYVEDYLEDGSRRSSYLVSGTRKTYHTGRTWRSKDGTEREAQIFPQGETRQRINKAVRKLVDVLREEKALEKALRALGKHSLKKALTHERFMVTAMLEPGKVKKLGVGRFGARKVTFTNGVQATLKPRLYSNELFRRIRRDTQYLREAAVYQLDRQILRFGVVPPTTLTQYKGEPASIQAWVTGIYAKQIVRSPFNHAEEGWRTRLALLCSKINVDDLRKIVIMDLVVNNTDRHGRNCLFDTFTDRTWAIDNGLAFGHYYKKYFNVFHREIFRRTLILTAKERELLRSITRGQLSHVLSRFLTAREIEETYLRIQWMLEQPNLGFVHISQGIDDKNTFPSYKEWFRRKLRGGNKVLALVGSMGELAVASA